MKKGFTASGFTLIELMIAVTIISTIVAMGLSAYGKARERQVGVLAGEEIISILQSNQGNATTGKKDCSGKYLGQEVSISTPNTITTRSLCEGNNGGITSYSINGVTFDSNTTFIFTPLTTGLELQNGSAQYNISYVSTANLTYIIRITNSGTIEYLGIQ